MLQKQVNEMKTFKKPKRKTKGFVNKPSFRTNVGRLMGSLGLLAVIAIFVIILTILSPVFLTSANITNLFIQSTILTVLSLGSTFVIMTGGIDLSIGSLMAVSSTIGLGSIVHNHVPVVIGIMIMLVIGAVFGAFNGLFVTKFDIPPLIVTLATMGMGRGIVLIYTNGANITPVPESFIILANGRLLGIPIILIFVVFLSLIAGITLAFTAYGRVVCATGGNELAARLAGIRTKLVIATTYVISGLTAAIGGILLAARLESAGPTAGIGIEMTVIAAVVIGGTSLFGGQGNIVGTILGVVVISLISNSVNLLGVPPAWDQLVKGAIILIAALLDVYRRKYANSIKGNHGFLV